MKTTFLAQILFSSQIGLRPISWKEANRGGAEIVKKCRPVDKKIVSVFMAQRLFLSKI